MMEKDRIRRRSWRRSALAALTLLLAGMLAGCGEAANGGNEPPSAEATPTPVPTAAPTPEPTPTPPPFTASLTGLPLGKEAAERPIAVMVNNMSLARPQSGLPHADMIWEVLAEGGITRLVAIFQSDDFKDPIGPIRSNRPYLIDIGDMYNAVLAHAGASTDGYDILQHHGKDYLDEISNAGGYFWRESFRKPPHNLYSNLEKLRKGAAAKKYESSVPIPSYPFSEAGAAALGTPAANVEIHFLLKNYKVSYAYDPASRLYARSINAEPHTDLTTKRQLTASNVAVIGAKHHTYDDYGRLEIDLSSGGPAVLIQLGKAIECTWERTKGGPIRLMKDGRELPFVPGQTFYHVVPMTPTFAEHVKIG